MPNIKSAKKRVKLIRIRTQRNKAVKSMVKTAIRRFHEALAEGNEEKIQETFRRAIKLVDKAAAKGVIHKNNAARKKSKLYRKLNERAS
ncbi:30S ribosomal protein S20 [Calderihabitans maritimus]|uniref:Small ribosomal subunit protein bS20 n=1 Tax=Calderihabitans maritimus TaxID=1246530 RepID=A0A1Z5HVV8_9FIRM|nr:30S ribosomal protein S20 [Calderihabitans maritimus]GAW93461.1 30S ribosomal protein S20 [Calderihabitans maritimus]